jgi:hypothetical protein
MQLATTAPTLNPGESLRLEVKWYWLSAELPASGVYNDFAQILVLPQPSGTPVPVMYIDTFSPLVAPTNNCASGVSNWIYPNGVGSPQTTVVDMPQSLSGQQVIIDVIAANQGDASFDSVLWVDEFKWEVIPPSAPVASVTSFGAPCLTITLASTLPIAGTTVTLNITGAFGSTAWLLMGSQAAIPLVLAPGCEFYLDQTTGTILQLPLAGGSTSVQFPLPTSFAGMQLMLQAAELVPALSPLGIDLSNGLLLTIG